ncbi:MAG: dihydrolipoyl dehydrogenase [Alphaproteobacteria bacterium]|nr:dihydrolipoyl dehydrogenase [Alphaproteobacteria bacterium]
MAENFDVVIIGGGPGGYVAAVRAAQLGLAAALVEREHLGGICLNWGCIPTKALLKSAEMHHLLHRLDEYGFAADNIRFDLTKIIARSRAVATQLKNGVGFLMRKNKVKVFDGEGHVDAPGRVTVTKNGVRVADLAAKHIVLATGARARTLPGLVPDGKLVWSYKEAMVPDTMPASLLVIGSGAIGIEFASFYRDLGAKVTVVEVLDRILPVEDEEISALARKAFEADGMTIHTGATVKSLERGANKLTATVEIGGKLEKIVAERAILAVGIVGNVENIGLEAVGVKVEKWHVVVDKWLRTDAPGIYAIGDLVGPPWLAHKAMHEAVVCIDRIAGHEAHPLNASRVPGCTYSRPQVASLGLTEKAARDKGLEIRIGRFPFRGNGKAIALGEKDGLVKTVFDAKTGELIGAHMIGAEVTELIQGFTIARTLEATELELMGTVFPHPTLSEMMHEAVLDAYGRVLHI